MDEPGRGGVAQFPDHVPDGLVLSLGVVEHELEVPALSEIALGVELDVVELGLQVEGVELDEQFRDQFPAFGVPLFPGL